MVIAAYLINRMPTRVLDGWTPFELLYRKKPKFQHSRVFGCLCYVTIVDPRDKMGLHAHRCVFMGYPSLQKGYPIFESSTGDFL